MDISTILDLIKARLGIRTEVRDGYLTEIAKSVIKELEDEKGIVLEAENSNHVMFIVDYATWRYQSRDSTGAMPKHLMWRMKNLYIHNGGA